MAEEAPDEPRYDPAGHMVHAVTPVDLWYDPAGHVLQVDAPVEPWYVPAVHRRQAVAPAGPEYSPVGQGVHVVPFPKKPAMHLQVKISTVPAGHVPGVVAACRSQVWHGVHNVPPP